MTTYTREHLEIVYKAGQKNIPLDDLLAVISLIEDKAAGRKPKRGRPAGSTKTAKPAKKKGRKSGKRGALGQKITDFLVGKPKGEHVKAIAAAVGTKPNNVTAWIYSTGKSKVKKVAPATFSLSK